MQVIIRLQLSSVKSETADPIQRAKFYLFIFFLQRASGDLKKKNKIEEFKATNLWISDKLLDALLASISFFHFINEKWLLAATDKCCLCTNLPPSPPDLIWDMLINVYDKTPYLGTFINISFS